MPTTLGLLGTVCGFTSAFALVLGCSGGGGADDDTSSVDSAWRNHGSSGGNEGGRHDAGAASHSHHGGGGGSSSDGSGNGSSRGSGGEHDAGSTTVGTGSGSGSEGSGDSSGSSGDSSGSSGGSSSGSQAFWRPTTAAPIHFHWMIGGSFGPSDILPNQDAQTVYDIDGETSTAADVAAIHAVGAIAVCYVDVGTLEQGRSDYSQFPGASGYNGPPAPSVVGPGVEGWAGENWLLVTAANQGVILSLMEARFENWCLAKGFDAIEPDNLDGWTNISNVNETDNVNYDLAIGRLAHALPLSVGCKNVMTDLDSSQYPEFIANFDWALNEQCYQYGECDTYTAAGSFLPAGKAVFDVEYGYTPDCSNADSAHINAQETDLDLVGATDNGYQYKPCIADSQGTW